MDVLKNLNLNLTGIALITPAFSEYISLHSKREVTLLAIIIMILLNTIFLYRSINGLKQNESGSVLAFFVSFYGLLLTAIMFVVFCL